MSMYTLKSIAQRGTTLSAALAMLVAAVIPAVLPAVSAYADALNPLTDRSLALSSSSPGWSSTDGSQNATYAPPNSGANGYKTGNTFAFKVSTDTTSTPVKAFTFQYCTTPAGSCTNPGNDTTPGTDDLANGKSDLNVVAPSAAYVPDGSFSTIVDTATGIVKAVPGYAGYSDGKPGGTTGIGGAGAAVTGNFMIYYQSAGVGTTTTADDTWSHSTSNTWAMTASTSVPGGVSTTKKNFITLADTTGQGFASGTPIKVVFFGTTNNYITNPGAGAFFVRMNTYKSDTTLDDANLLDGGVTVANVMNQSIWIQTKVLETMQFSVGTVDPNTLDSSDGTDGGATPANNVSSTLEKALYAGAATAANSVSHTYKGTTPHTPCDGILGNVTPAAATNVLQLGDQASESSLSTLHTYSTNSYWRLSSNSSAGATVYYSGHTLTNTVGDEITAIGPSSTVPTKGAEQFGLALSNTPAVSPTSVADLKVDYTQDGSYEHGNGPTTGVHASTLANAGSNASWHLPTLYPLVPATAYKDGAGNVDGTALGTNAQFAFVRTSDTIPVPLASENSQVVDCVTGKMRYIANIAATTPAGIYTTKVNYIAAPQY